MFPLTCFSCGRPIGHLWLTYIDKLGEAKTVNVGIDINYQTTSKFDILRELKIGDECCRRMFICQMENMYDLVI